MAKATLADVRADMAEFWREMAQQSADIGRTYPADDLRHVIHLERGRLYAAAAEWLAQRGDERAA